MLETAAPLVLDWDLEFPKGEIITVGFQYERLDRYCKRCYQVTHDKHTCPERQQARPSRGQPRREGREGDKRRRSDLIPDSGLNRRGNSQGEQREERSINLVAQRKKPVRRNLFDDEGSSSSRRSPTKASVEASRAWVRRPDLHLVGGDKDAVFPEEETGGKQRRPRPEEEEGETGGLEKPSTLQVAWYRESEMEARAISQAYNHQDL